MTEHESRGRGEALATLVTAVGVGLACSAAETVHQHCLAFPHRGAYLALTAGLTLVFSILVGVITSTLKGRPSRMVVPVWWAAAGFFVRGTGAAIVFVILGVLADRAAPRERAAPLARGLYGGFAFALGVLLGPRLVGLLGLGALPLGLGPTLAVGAVLFGLFLALEHGDAALRARLPGVVRAAALVALALAVSMHPLVLAHHPSTDLEGLPEARPREGERDNVILLVLDTVRADHMSVYGYERETTPELAKWIEQRGAAVFESAYANATWTVPSHATLFTGTRPNLHGAHFDPDPAKRRAGFFQVDELAPRLADEASKVGYRTVGTFANNWLRVVGGIDVGFEKWFLAGHPRDLLLVGEALRRRLVPGLMSWDVKLGPRAWAVNRDLLRLLNWSGGEATLAFANYGETHGPYAPEPPFRGRYHPSRITEEPEHLRVDMTAAKLERLEARYDEEMTSLDHHLGALFTELDRRGYLDRSWVFVTSDHGEAFGEHGVTEHGTTVHDEVVRVPLIVFPPSGQSLPTGVGPVDLIDVTRTIAAIVEADWESELRSTFEAKKLALAPGEGFGRDLRDVRTGEAVVAIEFYGDQKKAGEHGASAGHRARSVIVENWKLIERFEPGDAAPIRRVSLYDLSTDAGESVDVSAERTDIVDRLAPLLPEFRDATEIPPDARMDPGSRRALEGHGYLSAED